MDIVDPVDRGAACVRMPVATRGAHQGAPFCTREHHRPRAALARRGCSQNEWDPNGTSAKYEGSVYGFCSLPDPAGAAGRRRAASAIVVSTRLDRPVTVGALFSKSACRPLLFGLIRLP